MAKYGSDIFGDLLKLLTLGVVLGLCGSFAANLFVIGASSIFSNFTTSIKVISGVSDFSARLILLLLVGYSIIVLKRSAGLERWHGPADTLAAVQIQGQRLDVKAGLVSTFAAFGSASAGASVGQYGPILHFGASIGASLKSMVPRGLSPDVYIAGGAAAAISAGFGAPVAAVVLVSEAVLRHFSVRYVAPVVTASVVASASSQLLFGRSSPYVLTGLPLDMTQLMLPILVLGIACALSAITYMRSIAYLLARTNSFESPLITVSLAAVAMALLGTLVPESAGLGTATINELFGGSLSGRDALVIFCAKFIATVICLGAGFFGGVFSPALFLGATLGYLCGVGFISLGLDPIFLPAMTVIGMAAFTSSVVGAPIGITLICFEFTQSYSYAVASLLGVSISSFISTRLYGYSYFDRQLRTRGLDLRKGGEFLSLKSVKVGALPISPVFSVEKDLLCEDALKLAVESQSNEVVVIDGGAFLGTTTVTKLLPNRDKRLASVLLDNDVVLHADDDLAHAIDVIKNFIGEAIPVVDENNVLLGGLSEGQILSGAMDFQEGLKRNERN